MSDRHIMETEASLPHGWMVQCPDCDRRVFFHRDSGVEFLDVGDPSTLHSWTNEPGMALTAELADE